MFFNCYPSWLLIRVLKRDAIGWCGLNLCGLTGLDLISLIFGPANGCTLIKFIHLYRVGAIVLSASTAHHQLTGQCHHWQDPRPSPAHWPLCCYCCFCHILGSFIPHTAIKTNHSWSHYPGDKRVATLFRNELFSGSAQYRFLSHFVSSGCGASSHCYQISGVIPMTRTASGWWHYLVSAATWMSPKAFRSPQRQQWQLKGCLIGFFCLEVFKPEARPVNSETSFIMGWFLQSSSIEILWQVLGTEIHGIYPSWRRMASRSAGTHASVLHTVFGHLKYS